MTIVDATSAGSNAPPIDALIEQIVDYLTADQPERKVFRAKLETAVAAWDEKAPEIANDGQEERATMLAADLRKAISDEEDARVDASAPLRSAAARINAAFNSRVAPLDAGKRGIDGRITRRLAAKKSAAKVEADRMKAEAETARNAGDTDRANTLERGAVAAAKVGPIKTTGGASAQARKHFEVKIVDFEKVPRRFLQLNAALALANLKAGEKIDGLELVEEARLTVRKS